MSNSPISTRDQTHHVFRAAQQPFRISDAMRFIIGVADKPPMIAHGFVLPVSLTGNPPNYSARCALATFMISPAIQTLDSWRWSQKQSVLRLKEKAYREPAGFFLISLAENRGRSGKGSASLFCY